MRTLSRTGAPLLGLARKRCADDKGGVRKAAVECLEALMRAQRAQQGTQRADHVPGCERCCGSLAAAAGDPLVRAECVEASLTVQAGQAVAVHDEHSRGLISCMRAGHSMMLQVLARCSCAQRGDSCVRLGQYRQEHGLHECPPVLNFDSQHSTTHLFRSVRSRQLISQ